jgi:hypothetical protein
MLASEGNDPAARMVVRVVFGPDLRPKPKGMTVVQAQRIESSIGSAAILVGALCFAALVIVPAAAHAEGLFDFLFGGFHRPAPPDATPYAEPSTVSPPPLGQESVRQGDSGIGRSVTYCVRLCDGQHFPIGHVTNATPVETCRAMCPASKTKVFSGSEIGGAVARDGQRYADLDTAFIYRKQLVANCTCNGKDAFGLAPYDATKDPTLQPGDIVSTKDGFVAFNGKSGQSDAFTPIDTSTVTAQLMPGASPARLARRTGPAAVPPPAVDDDPGTITPSQTPRPLVDIGGQSAR